jgi:hypothetical protein
VRKLGGAALVFFGFAAELGQGDDGALELAGEALDGAEISEISTWRFSARAEPA